MISKELKVAVRAARQAGKILMKYYGKTERHYKEGTSIVTKADREAEELIRSIIKNKFPDHSILGEEFGSEKRDSDYTWIIDPLDGTTNYSAHFPFFCVSIALTKNSEPILGVVYYPHTKEMFHAELGKGAFLNSKKISVSSSENIPRSVIGFCLTGKGLEDVERITKIFRKLKNVTNNVRQFGASALELAYVANGRIDAFLVVNAKSWDVAAGMLLVSEAGGKITDLSGKYFNLESYDLLASNGRIHDEILETIK